MVWVMGESTCVPKVPLTIPNFPHIPSGSLNCVQQHVVRDDEAGAGSRPPLHVHLHDLLPSLAGHQCIEEWVGSSEHVRLQIRVFTEPNRQGNKRAT